MSSSNPVNALVIGAISFDVEGGAAPLPGGVVHHAGRALARLGARTRVVTSARAEDLDELLGPLRAEGVETSARHGAFTTVCENDYSGLEDAHELRAVSDPIRLEDVPHEWRDAGLVHLGPLHREDLHPDLPGVLHGLIGMDLQGFVRERSPEGTRLAAFPDLPSYLRNVAVAKVSESELPLVLDGSDVPGFMRRHGVSELLITRGARGATIVTTDDSIAVPASPARRVHPVGAGDVFLAAYLYARVLELPPLEAGRLASRASAAKVERGEVPKGLGDQSEPGDARERHT